MRSLQRILRSWFIYGLVLHSSPLLFCQTTLYVNNLQPRLDNTGQIVDAHDGRVVQFGKKFYWYGTHYGRTNGFTTANEYVCYSSENLRDWKAEGPLLPQKPTGVYYRPHVVYNQKTSKYILWYNWYPQLWAGQFGVAESNSPTGPFRILNDNVKVKHSSLGVGDLGVFVDEDQKAYLSYNTISGHKVSVELLNDSYTASTMQGSEFMASNCEAGSLFKRNNLYYLLTDYTCCFCTQGSGAQVYTATNPLGPYRWQQNINRYPGIAQPLLQDGNTHDNWFETFEAKHQHGIEIRFNQASEVSDLTIHQFTGDRSGQCGEVNNPVVHEPILLYEFKFQQWREGEWKPLPMPKPQITHTSMGTTYQFAFGPITTDRLQITPIYSDTLSPLKLAEIQIGQKSVKYVSYKTGKQEGKPIIPAQQAYVMEVLTKQGIQYIWMGDLWGSASDNIKGHDYQFWSAPLQFYSNGLIKPIQWIDEWKLKLKR